PHRLGQSQPGLDAALLTGRAVMVEDALDPRATRIAIRTVGHDRRILQRYADLVVEPVGHPALNLLPGSLPGVHRSMERVMDMVVVALGTQRLFEFGWGHRWQGHRGFLCGAPQAGRRLLCRVRAAHRL